MAKRDVAKRAPGQAGAGGAGGAGGTGGAGAAGGAGGAAAAVGNLNVNVNSAGDWATQAADPYVLLDALGAAILIRRARAGDREAQFSQGCMLVADAGVAGTYLGAAGRSPKAEVGTSIVPVAHRT